MRNSAASAYVKFQRTSDNAVRRRLKTHAL
jgi:hypothetical protein